MSLWRERLTWGLSGLLLGAAIGLGAALLASCASGIDLCDGGLGCTVTPEHAPLDLDGGAE